MGAIGYAAPFLFALSIPALHYGVGPGAPLLTVVALLAVLVGAEALSPRGAVPVARAAGFALLPILYVPLQLAMIVWAIAIAGRTSILGFAALTLSIGVTTGVFGMLAAHELVHSGRRFERRLGLAMLTAMTYRHFAVAHVFGHHRLAATERDPASARLGESFYAFLVRTVPDQFRDAWTIENRRLKALSLSFLHHRVAADALIECLLYLALLAVVGWRGAAFLALESAVGIVVLELFNYVAHYGLVRRANGHVPEPFGERHSWNSSNMMANTIIFNMGRHSDHHTRPAAAYQTLRWHSHAPELPLGYAGSILAALVPPLWRRVMDPAVARLSEAVTAA